MPTEIAPNLMPLRRGNRWKGPDSKPYRQPSKFSKHAFNCFDGEGYDIDGVHQYVHLASWDGTNYRAVSRAQGLSTEACFRFLCDVAHDNDDGINVIYGGSYDANMMIRDLPEGCLEELRSRNWTHWHGWRVEYIPWKYLQITHKDTHKTCRLWDVIGFFQSSFITAIESWLGVDSKTINRGKARRGKFTEADLDFMAKYCREELEYLYALMQKLWECLDGAGIAIRRWDGAGSIAQTLLTMHNMGRHKGSTDAQELHYYFARCAYAGGWFENFRPGDWQDKAYGYDINSAYPYAISLLPRFGGLTVCPNKTHGRCDVGPYDLVEVDYKADVTFPIHPYFHRGKDLAIGHPAEHIGWHYGIEWLAAKQGIAQNGYKVSRHKIREHYVWEDDGLRPFAWVADMFEARQFLKAQGDPREKVLKLGLNSLYGKLAQQRGWKEGQNIPKFHQLYWAGWVTAKCRSMVYGAMMQKPDAIIAVETDGIISTEPLDLPLGNGLGEWDYKEYDWITYVQSGLYFAGRGDEQLKLRSRGIVATSISRDKILKGWARYDADQTESKSYVVTKTTRFHTFTSCLAVGDMSNWRQWRTMNRHVALVPIKTGKRAHLSALCGAGCRWGENYLHRTIPRHMPNPESVPYAVLWATDPEVVDALQELYDARDIDKEESIYDE